MINNSIDEKRVKELIMAEVSKQIQPLHEWMLAFWSNGSGRPPGFFQMRIKADDERYKRLEDETAEQSEVLRRLDTNMQEIAAEKKADAERKTRRAERIAFWLPVVKWVAGAILTATLTIGAWATAKITPVIKILWEDYLHAHPVVTQEIKSISRDDDPAYTHKHNPAESSVEPH